MRQFILDTDMLSLFQHNHPKVVAAVHARPPAEIAIAVLTVEEQLSGWYKELRRAKKPAILANVYDRMARTVLFVRASRRFCHFRSQRSSATNP
jgi:tRNA(fMet)-specific endonuclease VapC